MTAAIPWSDAAVIAGRLAPPGPRTTKSELENLVASLRRAAGRAVALAVTITGMLPADGSTTEPLSTVTIVDRTGWAHASARSMAAMIGDALDPRSTSVPFVANLTSSAQVGGLLALLSTKILGQYDPFGDPRAQVLFVAPNILQAERTMKVPPEDLRLWICLHEQTHALQHTAAPWIADYLSTRARDLVAEAAPSTPRQAAAHAAATMRAVHAAVRGEAGPTLVDGLLTGRQRAAFADTTALMTLLEGHADVSMDAVDPLLVPSVRAIRTLFTARRNGGTSQEKILRRLLGMDLKMAQYRDGATFVRAVTARVGTHGFNAVWTSPDLLPTMREIADPVAWVRRVHG